MLLELDPIDAQREAVLRHLVDLYVYDFSEMLGLDVGEDGRFPFRDLSVYFSEDWRHAFFIRVGGKLAGFVLVHTRSRLTDDLNVNDMAEFFVLRRYRRQGVGERAAVAVFERFPGVWEVRERASNTGAVAFWRRVIARYTNGAFQEVEWDNETWRGPVQSFTK
jgi:predicted acetyltransferase